MDHPLYSFELHDLETGHQIAYGKDKHFVYSMRIDPDNHLNFVACT